MINTASRSVSAAALLMTLLMPIAEAGEIKFSSGDNQVALVELYTSEGCSSCPPAERFMSTFLDDRDLWKSFVPVAFHVDYWDYIGWKDPYASPAYTKRQREHAWRLGMGTIYTPGFFTAGNEWRRWRKTNPAIPDETPGVLDVVVNDNRVMATFTPKGVDVDKRFTIHIAVLGFDLSSSVERGENAGRTLEHDFIVLGDNTVPLKSDNDGRLTAELDLPDLRAKSERTALAAWVSYNQDPEPLQATGGWLTQISN